MHCALAQWSYRTGVSDKVARCCLLELTLLSEMSDECDGCSVSVCWFLFRLEVVVDPWIEGLWEALKDTFSKMSLDTVQAETETGLRQDGETQRDLDSAVGLHLLKLTEVEPQKEKAQTPVSESERAEAPGVPEEASLIRSVLPLSGSSLSVPALPPPYLEVLLEDVSSEEVGCARRSVAYFYFILQSTMKIIFFSF